jgi:undecaprenyl phosphate-alpha-L-ara4N flippase subunit ArnE
MWKLALNNQHSLFFYGMGFALYAMGALSMILALRFGELSGLHPILSLGFVLSVVWGGAILREKISVVKLLGVGLISVGVILLNYRRSGRSQ